MSTEKRVILKNTETKEFHFPAEIKLITIFTKTGVMLKYSTLIDSMCY
jgi:hypothetical protein